MSRICKAALRICNLKVNLRSSSKRPVAQMRAWRMSIDAKPRPDHVLSKDNPPLPAAPCFRRAAVPSQTSLSSCNATSSKPPSLCATWVLARTLTPRVRESPPSTRCRASCFVAPCHHFLTCRLVRIAASMQPLRPSPNIRRLGCIMAATTSGWILQRFSCCSASLAFCQRHAFHALLRSVCSKQPARGRRMLPPHV